MTYPIVDIKSKKFEEELCKAYEEYGVCVIKNVVEDDKCDAIMDNIISNFEKLGTGLDRNKPETWTEYNLPVMTRAGMFQATMCNLPVIWETKVNPNIVKIFETLYGKFRKTTDLVLSNDGINIKHGAYGPFHDKDKDFAKDWAHIDQTITDNPFYCVQGQLVMTNTSSAFRCTPRSHHHLKYILRDYDLMGFIGNWFKFNLTQKKAIKDFLAEEGVTDWQVPIQVPKGSFIVWSSACIHSAKFADEAVFGTKEDPWKGWRGVLYISYRPRMDMSNSEIAKKYKAIKENRVLNHWGNKTFPHITGGGYNRFVKRHEIIKELIDEPDKVYPLLGIDIDKVLKNEEILKYIT
jgi:hypothetical protein